MLRAKRLSYEYWHKSINCYAPVGATERHSERSTGGSMTEHPNERVYLLRWNDSEATCGGVR